jgi:hypothetical protein
MKSREVSPTCTTVKCESVVGGERPRTPVRKRAVSAGSRACTIVWFRLIAMRVLREHLKPRSGSGAGRRDRTVLPKIRRMGGREIDMTAKPF